MRLRKILDCALLAAAVFSTRFAFRSHWLYDLDSVNFALALDHFDPAVHQPHPPGYFLYVCLGRLAYALFQDANTALVALSILASCAAVVVIYGLADAWFGRRAAVFAGLIFLFSPLAWFHGTVALTYIFEAFFSALIGYFCWQVYTGRAVFVIPSAVALAAAAGFRQSSILFLCPLWLWSLRRARARHVFLAFAALALAIAAWFIPMTLQSGGLGNYFLSLWDLWMRVPGKRTALSSSLAAGFSLVVVRSCAIAVIYALTFGVAGPLLFLSRNRAADREKKLFLWIWVAPALLFFTFVFLNFINSGYLLVASPPIFVWLGSRAASWWPGATRRGWRQTAALASAAALHVAVFLYAPLYCSRRSVRDFEAELAAIQKTLPQVVSPQNTLIVSFDSHFLGYRHAAYYLPDYWTVQYPEVPMPAGRRVFAMRHNRTHLLRELPVDCLEHFVLFPLPQEPSFQQFLDRLTARFDPGALQTKTAAGRRYLIGSIADLHLLFPATGSRPLAVSTTVDAGH